MPTSEKRHTPKPGELSEQGNAFIETARAIGCDEDEAAFKARLGKLLSAPAPMKNIEAGDLERKPTKAKKAVKRR